MIEKRKRSCNRLIYKRLIADNHAKLCEHVLAGFYATIIALSRHENSTTKLDVLPLIVMAALAVILFGRL